MNKLQRKKGILLINLGTPRSLKLSDVRTYLREFLTDPRVITLPWIFRQLLVQLIIVPFRSPKSREAYASIWTSRGSPLMFHLQDTKEKLQHRDVGEVEIAMRYQQPSIGEALKSFYKKGISEVCVIPLFPQYSSAAFGSAVEAVYEQAKTFWNTPYLRVIPPFFDHPKFTSALAEKIRGCIGGRDFDKILFSYHGLPESHCTRSDLSSTHCFASKSCCEILQTNNQHCYKAQCFATTQAVVSILQLKRDQYDIAFQSRLGRQPWIKPYTDKILETYAEQSYKRVFVVCPAFVADCLETLEEIGIRAKEQYETALPGSELELIPCLNSDDAFIDLLKDLIS